ncbi:hypothetical protein ACFX2I_047276 [Malus domestica]
MVERLSGKSLEHSGMHVLLPNMYVSTNQWDNVVRSTCFMPFLLTFLSEEGNRYFGCGCQIGHWEEHITMLSKWRRKW